MEEELRQLREELGLLEQRLRTVEMQGQSQGDLSPIIGPIDIKLRNLQKVGMAIIDRSTMPQEDKEVLFRLLNW
jgi:DNA-binding protein YbaB